MITIKSFNCLPGEAREIRKKVFTEEQGFQEEFDSIDDYAVHFLCYDGNKPVATCRVFWSEEKGTHIVGRVAVLKEYRGREIGRLLMQESAKLVASRGGGELTVSAQTRAARFYEKNGFTKVGEVYEDEGCPHIKMIKKWR